MNNFIESTWIAPIMGEKVKALMESYIKYVPRRLQSEGYSPGPITIANFQKFERLCEQLKKEGLLGGPASQMSK